MPKVFNQETFNKFKREVRCLKEVTIPDFEQSVQWINSYVNALRNQSIHIDPESLLGFSPAERLTFMKTRAGYYDRAISQIERGERPNPMMSINKCLDGISHLYQDISGLNEKIHTIHVQVEDEYGLPAIIVYSANRPNN